MSSRTSLVLDEPTRRAAKELAARYDCSVSEAIRRAILKQRDLAFGVSMSRRKNRKQLLTQLTKLFRDNDAVAEIARLKREDEGF